MISFEEYQFYLFKMSHELQQMAFLVIGHPFSEFPSGEISWVQVEL